MWRAPLEATHPDNQIGRRADIVIRAEQATVANSSATMVCMYAQDQVFVDTPEYVPIHVVGTFQIPRLRVAGSKTKVFSGTDHPGIGQCYLRTLGGNRFDQCKLIVSGVAYSKLSSSNLSFRSS